MFCCESLPSLEWHAYRAYEPGFWKAHVLLELLGSTALMEDTLLTALHSEVALPAAHVAGVGLVSAED